LEAKVEEMRMEIYVEGGRSSSESWTRAHRAPLDSLPNLSEGQKAYVSKLGLDGEAYARSLLAQELELPYLEKKAEKAARVIEKIGAARLFDLRVRGVLLNTLQGKYRFEVVSKEDRHDEIVVSEDLIDELLETGTESSERQIARILEFGLPGSWTVRAS